MIARARLEEYEIQLRELIESNANLAQELSEARNVTTWAHIRQFAIQVIGFKLILAKCLHCLGIC